MEVGQKKFLGNIVYYTLIAIMVAFEVFFMINLAPATMALWEKVALYILSGALAFVAIYDLIISFSSKTSYNKYINGFILYGVTLAVAIVTLVIFALNSTEARLFTELSERFFRLIIMLYVINAITLAVYFTGKNIIELDSKSKNKISKN